MARSESIEAVAWLHAELAAALTHMQPGHCYDDPLCCERNIEQWLLDSFAEELEIIYGITRSVVTAGA